MKAKFALILLSVCMIAGSSSAFGQKLYPVSGPLAAQTPPPVFSAKLTGVASGSIYDAGNISLELANGETFKGKWTTVPASSINVKAPGSPSSYPPQPDLAFAWDSVYTQGFYMAHVLGEYVGKSLLTGDQGTVIQIEFLNGHVGVAVDNKGNMYKMVW